MAKVVCATLCGSLGLMGFVAYKNRPLVRAAEFKQDKFGEMIVYENDYVKFLENGAFSLKKRLESTRKRASRQLRQPSTVFAPHMLFLTQSICISLTWILTNILLRVPNELIIKGKVDEFRELIYNRDESVPLITISNHASVVDDPVIFVGLQPLCHALKPQKSLRWALCSEEICFKNKLMSALMISLKVLPIERGAGIEQNYLRVALAKLNQGEWVHVFPEGKTVQSSPLKLGGREPPRSKQIGLLKWGVAKLIAKSRITPIVIPIFHRGMQGVYPHKDASRKSRNLFPKMGNRIEIVVGKPINVQAIINKHMTKRYTRSNSDNLSVKENDTGTSSWDSTLEDYNLYMEIMLCIQAELESLQLQ